MKRMYRWLLLIMVFLVCEGNAQSINVGVKAGVSIPNLTTGGTNTPINSGYSSIFGPDGSIFAEIPLCGAFRIVPTIEYSSQGGKKNGFQALDATPFAPMFPPGHAPQYLYATYNSTANLDYLLIPVVAQFDWSLGADSPWKLYAAPGPFAGFLLSAKQVTSGSSPLYLDAAGQEQVAPAQSFNSTQDIKSELYTFNFGIEGNLGVSYGFGRNSLRFEAGGNYGFLNIQRGTENGKNFTGAATAYIGYAYELGD
jgi:hypothetical protein